MSLEASVKASEFYACAVEIEDGLKQIEGVMETEAHRFTELDWTWEKMDIAIAQTRALNGIARCLALLVAQRELAP